MATKVQPYRDCFFCCAPAFPEEDLEPITADSPTWKNVVVLKKDENGNFLIRKDKAGKEVISENTYTLHVKSGELYNQEDPSSIAIKCGLITIGNIFYTIGMMFFHLGKIIYDIGKIAIDTLKEVGKQFKEKGTCEALKSLIKGFFWNLPGAIFMDLYCVVRDPIFGVAMEFAAIVGVFSPLNGRRMIAHIEYKWHFDTSYKKDARYIADNDDECCKVLFTKAEVQYLAFCMQTRGNVKENDRLVIKTQSLLGSQSQQSA